MALWPCAQRSSRDNTSFPITISIIGLFSSFYRADMSFKSHGAYCLEEDKFLHWKYETKYKDLLSFTQFWSMGVNTLSFLKKMLERNSFFCFSQPKERAMHKEIRKGDKNDWGRSWRLGEQRNDSLRGREFDCSRNN